MYLPGKFDIITMESYQSKLNSNKKSPSIEGLLINLNIFSTDQAASGDAGVVMLFL